MQKLIRVVVFGVLTICSLPAMAQQTLEAVKKRGQVMCGVDGTLPGFSFLNAVKEWEGLDVDLCRAIAAATLGDASKVQFVRVTAEERFDKLAAGEFDVLTRNTTGTLQRTAGSKVQFVVPNYYDGQGFVVPKKLKIDQLAGLRGATICVTKGRLTSSTWRHGSRPPARGRADGLRHRRGHVQWLLRQPLRGGNRRFHGPCRHLRTIGQGRRLYDAAEIISKEPLGPYVRNNDPQWFEIVRWTHYAMVDAEERGITPKSIDALKREVTDPNLRLFLGVDPGNGKALGLSEDWAYNVIKQVGNYGEIYEKNVGMGSALKFARRCQRGYGARAG